MSQPESIDEQERLEHGQLIRRKRLILAALRVWELKQRQQEEPDKLPIPEQPNGFIQG